MDKLKEQQSDLESAIKSERLTADQYAVVEDISQADLEDLPELRRLTFGQVIIGRLKEAFSPHGDPISPKLLLRRAPIVLWGGLVAGVRWPFNFAREKADEFAGWVEIQKALIRHRRRRRERIKNLSRLRSEHILRMLEEDPLVFDRERPTLKGKELLRWYWLSFLHALYSRLELLTPAKRRKNLSAKVKAEKGSNEKEGPTTEARGLKAVSKRWNDYWANITRKDNRGLFTLRKDSKLKLSKEQWRKLESVYARARRLMHDGNYDEAILSFESCIQLLGRNTGDSIYEGLGMCKRAVFEREVPKKPLEWIRQESHEVHFCFQQAAWVNPGNAMHSKRAAEIQRLAEMWEDNHRELAADIDRLNYEMSLLEPKYPDHVGLAAARRELYNAKVSLSVWGYADAEKIVIHCRELLDHLRA